MPRARPFLVWLAAVVAGTGMAWGALNAADRNVNTPPLSPVIDAQPGLDATTTVPAGSTTATPATTATTAPVGSSSTTLAESAPPEAAEWQRLSIPSAGGIVVVGWRPNEVRLESSTPNPGFVMEIDKQGPDEVRVEFSNGDISYEHRARWKDGAVDAEVKVSG